MNPDPEPMTTTHPPVLIRRDGDLGWLASTPLCYPLRFAVEGKDENEARVRYEEAIARWESLSPVEGVEE